MERNRKKVIADFFRFTSLLMVNRLKSAASGAVHLMGNLVPSFASYIPPAYSCEDRK